MTRKPFVSDRGEDRGGGLPPAVNGGPLAWFGRLVLGLFGWRVVGALPEARRYVMIAAPHTSNWDFPIMLLCGMVLGVWPRWAGKHTLFTPPFGWVMLWLRGIPIDRRTSSNKVDQLVARIAQSEDIALLVPPEGTRSYAPYWKSGFYHVACKAGVPLAFGFLDYARKEGGIGPAFMPSGNVQEDMDRIRAFYSQRTGLHPEWAGPMRLRAEDGVEDADAGRSGSPPGSGGAG